MRRRGRGRPSPPGALSRPLLLLLLAAGLAAGRVAAQDPVPAAETAAAEPPASVRRPASVMAAVTDARGRPVEELAVEAVTVREGGEERPIFAVSRDSAEPWRITLYLDLALTAETSPGWVGRILEERAAELTALGWVEVVAAGDEPRLLQPATRDPTVLAAALGRVFLLERGADRLVEERRRALELLATAAPGEETRRAVSAAAVDEAERVRRRHDALLAWIADRPAGGARALLLVNDGYDLDPAAFYRRAVERQDAAESAEAPPEPAPESAPGPAPESVPESAPGPVPELPTGAPLAGPTRELGRALAAYGWVVLAIVPDSGEPTDVSRFGAAVGTDPASGEKQPMASIRLPRRRSAAEKAEDEIEAAAEAAERALRPTRPTGPLALLAEATGGEVLTAVSALPDALERLGKRWRIAFSSQPAADDDPRRLEVAVAGEGRAVAAPRWIGGATPRAVSALRARRMLDGDEAPGGLSLRARVELAAVEPALSRLEARVEREAAAGERGPDSPGTGQLRVTVASLDPRGEVRIEHRGLATAGGAVDADGRFGLGLSLPAGVERVAVVVEDLETGRWGGGLAGLVTPVGGTGEDAAETGAGAVSDRTAYFDADLGLLPAPETIHLLRPEGRVQRGEVRFDTVVSDPAVTRVEFLLDGRTVARRDSPPFAATLDLGKLPLLRRVEAVAYRADGSAAGRDVLVVNEGGRDFSVRITEPSVVPAPGPIDFAAEVTAPPGRRVDRVELYFGERRLATLFAPPYRHRLDLGALPSSGGFLRAVARLDDDRSVEDVFFLDERGTSERIDVNLVELYVVVSDRAGRPVRGLDRDEFEVREDGTSQQLASFGEAGDLPLTVGLAIDSSASMFAKLPSVQEAAASFLGSLERGRDRAFLVDFDDRPALAAQPTLDLGRIASAIGGLRSSGRTSLWESIVYSLVQLQGQEGRKALVVYSDGADQDEDFSYRTCLRFARRLGIPIYVIVSNNEAVRTDGLGRRSFGDRLDRLTSSVGGRTFLVRTGEDLSAIYAQIERELSSQYLLTYYSDGPPRRGAWREVEVEVDRRGLSARTVAGYQL